MKSKIFRVLLTVALVAGFGLVTAVPASADVTSATVVVVPTTAGEADAEYTIVFDVGAAGALAADGTITIVFPDDTAVADDTGAQGNIAGTVKDAEAAETIVTVTGNSSTRTVVITIPANVIVLDSGTVTVSLTAGITNPTAAGHYTLTVATSIEDTAIDSQTYTIAPLETAIADAEAALTASDAAKIAHIAAGGAAGDAEYVAVVTAEGVLNTALTAVPAVTADIVAATTALNDVVTLLEAETALLVAITEGTAELVLSAAAKDAHIAAGGATGDTVYIDVVTKEGTLATLLSTGTDTTAITNATTALNIDVATLEAATALLVAITNGDAELVLSGLAKTAYTDAVGNTSLSVYTDVVAAESSLEALLLIGTDTSAIATDTTALDNVVTLLEDATDALVLATAAAEEALVASGLAKTGHLAAGGEVTVAEYLAVVDAEIALEALLAAVPRVTATIGTATDALDTAVDALVVLTEGLAAAVGLAETAQTESTTAKADYETAGGGTGDAEYVAVAAKEVTLTAALAAVPQVTADITAATTNLDADVETLIAATGAITDGAAALALSATAKANHTTAAGAGATADTAYAAVVAKEVLLTDQLALDPKVTGDIGTAITNLDTDVGTLVTATEGLVAAIGLAETALVDSGLAKDAHIAAGGDELDTEYTNVVAKEGLLTDQLALDPKVTGDIGTATTALATDVGTLETATGVLELATAVADAEAAIAASDLALAAHTTAGGATEDAEYVAVVDADTALDTAISGGDTATIVAATETLDTAVAALETVTDLWTTYDKFLTLNAGWTLISTDKWIDSATSAWEGDATLKFKHTSTGFLSADFADLEPVEALYVKMPAGGWVGLNYLDVAPGMSEKDLLEGWNLISSGVGASAGAVLSPLQDIGSQGTGLTTLVSQGSYNLSSDDWYVDATTAWADVTSKTMDPFDGYWIYMNAAKSFGVILQ